MKVYAREIFVDSDGLMIICMFDERAHLLAEACSYEVDISYKRVKDKDMKEVVFAALFPQTGRVRTFCRIFTTLDTREGYHRLFKRVYQLLERITGSRPPISVIDGYGLSVVIADMCAKQYFGFADFLHDYDPDHRDGEQLMRQLATFCRNHFTRGVDDALRRSNGGRPDIRQRMLSLPFVDDRKAYNAVIDLIKEAEGNSLLTPWAEHKRQEWIMCGLNPACSTIPRPYFGFCQHTNAIEQTHHMPNLRGVQLPLLEAIFSSCQLDRPDLQEYQTHRQGAIVPQHRDSSTVASLTRHLQQPQKRRVSHNLTRQDREPSLEERRHSPPEDLALSQKRRQAETARLELEMLTLQAKKESLQADLLEARIRRMKAEKELDEFTRQ
ncbi:hypothetical protein N7535_008212 [Penicillium sp. DV-2018c]|nr:hypothetical protein N7535_008212 [Penicillium sp. DV-2018c]